MSMLATEMVRQQTSSQPLERQLPLDAFSIPPDRQRALESALNLKPDDLSNADILQEQISQNEWIEELLTIEDRGFWAKINPRLHLANEMRRTQTNEKISAVFRVISRFASKLEPYIPSIPSVPGDQEFDPQILRSRNK